ncbi:MAG TPA: putative transporter [Polyangiaceae bacterium]|nr:putative transporter [Polyangiaceae bacterium]
MSLARFQNDQPVAFSLLVLASSIVLGLGLGSLRIKSMSLGVAGVLFAGIVLGHFGLNMQPEVLAFVREFGLVLFVFGIGMQVGPSFFTSLQRQGLPLNLMAAGTVFTGAVLTLVLARALGIGAGAAVGIFAGATTNTPALAAAQEALKSLPDAQTGAADLPALGYAAAYPFGVIGIILTMLLVRTLLRIDLTQEAAAFAEKRRKANEPLTRMNIVVDNPNLDGMRLSMVPGMREFDIVVSRVRPRGEAKVLPAVSGSTVHVGDTLLAVGAPSNLEKFRTIVGQTSPDDLAALPGLPKSERVIVTRTDVVGKTLRALALRERLGVTVTRVQRAEIELPANRELRLAFGDVLQIVGEPAAVAQACSELGNSLADMNHTNLLPIFLGIALGVLAGTYPIEVFGMPAPLRLGLAGGPLAVAILLARIGKIGPLVWYIPPSANAALRSLGIVLFLACVGVKAGEHFVALVTSGDGLRYMAAGALITIVPLLVCSAFARFSARLDFLTLSGLLAGSMTDPPALAFATNIARSDAPSVAYASVYPLTMLLRILVAQLLVLVM